MSSFKGIHLLTSTGASVKNKEKLIFFPNFTWQEKCWESRNFSWDGHFTFYTGPAVTLVFNFKESSWEIITVSHIHVNFFMLPCSLNVHLKLLFPQCLLQSTTASELPRCKIRGKWTMGKKLRERSRCENKLWKEIMKMDHYPPDFSWRLHTCNDLYMSICHSLHLHRT